MKSLYESHLLWSSISFDLLQSLGCASPNSKATSAAITIESHISIITVGRISKQLYERKIQNAIGLSHSTAWRRDLLSIEDISVVKWNLVKIDPLCYGCWRWGVKGWLRSVHWESGNRSGGHSCFQWFWIWTIVIGRERAEISLVKSLDYKHR